MDQSRRTPHHRSVHQDIRFKVALAVANVSRLLGGENLVIAILPVRVDPFVSDETEPFAGGGGRVRVRVKK